MIKSRLQQIFLILLIFQITISNAQVKFDTPYGNNKNIGKYVKLNGAKIYYEEYGKGEPLLLIHGNGGDIKSMENQIDYFKNKYRVIVADSRGQGKSELKTDSLTYNQITSDWEGLVHHLKLDAINIIGWSDGGIIGLKMGISNKTKIKKVVAMGANLRPDTTAVNSSAPEGITKQLLIAKKMIASGDTSKNWNTVKQLYQLLLYQPDISHSDLQKINAAVLIMVGDRDIIKNEHAVEMFNHLPIGQLCIMPGGNHGAPQNKPEIFNEIANRFLSEQFVGVGQAFKGVTVDENVLSTYLGVYELRPDFTITITRTGNQLFAQATGQKKIELFAKSKNEFYPKVFPAQITFSDKDGKVISLTLYQGGKESTAKRIK